MSIIPPDNSSMYKSAEGYRRSMAFYDSQLALITAPFTTQFVDTCFGPTHVLHAGQNTKPPVFLLHGMNASLITWTPQINALAENYSVYAADMPGGMGKSAPTRIPREGTAYGDWLVDVMNAAEVENASFVGVSFGSWLAINLASVAPQRMISTFLMSSAGFVRQSNKPILKMLPRFLIMPFIPFEKRADLFMQVMGAPGYKATPGDREMFGLILTEVKHDGRAPGAHTDEDLKRLTCPTALIYGEYEAAFNKDKALFRAKKLLPNLVQSQVLSGVGHGMTGEDAPRVNALISAFLKKYHIGNTKENPG